MPHANSRFSRPRAISPSASEGTLPCSAVRCAASSWRCVSTRFRILNMISVRFDSDVARQAGNAALAAATAASTSSAEAKSTCLRQACRSPGRRRRPRARTCPATLRPPIQWLTRPGAGGVRPDGSRLCDLRHGEDLCRCASPDVRRPTACRSASTILRRRRGPRAAVPPLRAPWRSSGSGQDGPVRIAARPGVAGLARSRAVVAGARCAAGPSHDQRDETAGGDPERDERRRR